MYRAGGDARFPMPAGPAATVVPRRSLGASASGRGPSECRAGGAASLADRGTLRHAERSVRRALTRHRFPASTRLSVHLAQR